MVGSCTEGATSRKAKVVVLVVVGGGSVGAVTVTKTTCRTTYASTAKDRGM